MAGISIWQEIVSVIIIAVSIWRNFKLDKTIHVLLTYVIYILKSNLHFERWNMLSFQEFPAVKSTVT